MDPVKQPKKQSKTTVILSTIALLAKYMYNLNWKIKKAKSE